ncbi:glycoside hydrolase family 35 protein [Cyathus striatus]|nr:glycoside hydrolase family 35 protein [Cyathus striatus]
MLGLASWGMGQSTVDNSNQYVLPVGSPDFYHGQSNASVTFDQHSVLLDGKRIMFFSGEFHPFRLPSPELWKDVLQKFKAAGFNGVSVYWHWGLTAPNSKEVRFTQHNDLAKFYQVAKDVGVLVIVRPGPYVNAETAGGGIPGWVSNIAGLARTNATDYKEAWLPYISGFAKETAPFQVIVSLQSINPSNASMQYPDGPVIAIQSENEFLTSSTAHITGLNEHMQDIIDTLRENGITKECGGQYAAAGLGKVDLYGWDGYPLGFNCDNPSSWAELSTQADTSHQRLNPAEPLALFEWQGGSFSYWSGPGYSECYQLINEQFANVFYKNNYAAEAAIQNLYMTYGGTNWGNMHTHTIYSSYESNTDPKLDELKLQGFFLHASPDYLTVGRIGNGTVGQEQHTVIPRIFIRLIYTLHEGCQLLRCEASHEYEDYRFELYFTSEYYVGGEYYYSEVWCHHACGRESKILVTNYPFGSSGLEYSTAEVATWATFDQVALELKATSKPTVLGSSSISVSTANKTAIISGTPSGITVVEVGNARVIVADKKTASGFWAPRLTGSHGFTQYDASPDVPSVLISGAYLVRDATAKGSTLALNGDINGTTTIDVFASSRFNSITWNGGPLHVVNSDIGSLRAQVAFPGQLNDVNIPVLEDLSWKCADSLPELSPDFDDSTWVVANKTSTKRPQKPLLNGKYVLYAGEYGFHAGQWVWRGHFAGNATGVQLAIQGGFSFGYSVFLNSYFLGSGQGSSHSQSGVDILQPVFNFTQDQLLPAENVLTVIHDSTGLNQDYNIDDEFKTPRGIRGYKLLSAGNNSLDFTEWRLAGNVGGEDAPDYVRGPYNEGGWWFERVGAHLPGYNDSSWKSCTPYDGIQNPGVTVYRTTLTLDLPRESDIPLAFDFTLDSAAPHRVLIYINGWQFGRFASSLGPQTSYPIPEGIVNHHGKNEILISLWALNAGGAKLVKLELNKRALIASSKSETSDIVSAPGWKELRG